MKNYHFVLVSLALRWRPMLLPSLGPGRTMNFHLSQYHFRPAMQYPFQLKLSRPSLVSGMLSTTRKNATFHWNHWWHRCHRWNEWQSSSNWRKHTSHCWWGHCSHGSSSVRGTTRAKTKQSENICAFAFHCDSILTHLRQFYSWFPPILVEYPISILSLWHDNSKLCHYPNNTPSTDTPTAISKRGKQNFNDDFALNVLFVVRHTSALVFSSSGFSQALCFVILL